MYPKYDLLTSILVKDIEKSWIDFGFHVKQVSAAKDPSLHFTFQRIQLASSFNFERSQNLKSYQSVS